MRQNHTISTFDNSDSWVILSEIEQSIKRKIEAVGTPLKDWDIQINYGIKTGFNDAFIITTEKREEILSACKNEDERSRTADLIRPILRGRDIKRYGYDWANLWLINTHNGIRGSIPRIDIKDYPAIKQHLDRYWDRISSRADKGDTPYNLRNCAYLDDFSKPKIVWKRVGSILRFSYDEKSNLSLDSTCFAVGDHIPFLVCLLNSPMGHYLLQNAPKTGTGDLLISVQAVEPLLIPLPDNNVESRISSQLSLLINKEDKEAEKKINSLIYQLYHLAPEEVEYIERI